MTSRRSFVQRAAATLAAWPVGAWAQRGAAVRRIGLLVPVATPNEAPFREALEKLGYVDGANVAIERRSADGDFSRLPRLAAELVRAAPDVIVTFVTQATIAAKQATKAIPIVMVAVDDPVASGLVGNLARPGGNLTGTASQTSAVIGKQLDLIRELRPGASRIATLWNPANAVFQQQSVREARKAAERLGVELRLVEARTADGLAAAVDAMVADRPDAALVMSEPLFIAHARRLADLLLGRRIAAVGGARAYVDAGMLAIYGPDHAESARRAAAYVDKILRGDDPAALPVELVEKFQLMLNLKTAKALGILVPPVLLARADGVVQ